MRCPTGLLAIALLAAGGCGGSGGDHGTQPDTTPATVVITPTTSQSIASGSSVSFSADVRNGAGSSIAGASVTWTSSNPSVAIIDQSGKVTGARTGTSGISASAGSVSSSSISVTVTPGAATQLAIRTQPAGSVSKAALTTQPVVEVRDAAGNLVTSSITTVTAAVSSGSATLSGSTSVNAVGGVATYVDLTLTGSGAATLTFTATSVTSATSAAVDIAPPPVSPASIAYGSTDGKDFLLTPNATASPTTVVQDSTGATLNGVAVTYATRAPGVATVNAHGTVTGVAEGAAWVVVTATGVADSIWVQVTKPNGPVLSTTLSRTTWHAGDTITVSVVLDTRTTIVGAAGILVSWSGDLHVNSTGVVTFADASAVGSGVTASGAEVYSHSIIRLTGAWANGLSGSETLVTFRLVARTDLGPAGGAGALYVVPLDMVALDESSLLSQTTSTHYPLIVK